MVAYGHLEHTCVCPSRDPDPGPVCTANSVSAAHSRSSLCWGSMSAASVAGTPKADASNALAPLTKVPKRGGLLPLPSDMLDTQEASVSHLCTVYAQQKKQSGRCIWLIAASGGFDPLMGVHPPSMSAYH
eukprot:1149387-Pelagomonas_calceolata.AAC.2